MKFLTDENIAVSVVRSLRQAGFDVKDAKEQKLHGTSDTELLSIAHKENRIILTHDKDFGNLINDQHRPHKGVILLRFKSKKPDNVIPIFLTVLTARQESLFENNLVIITETITTVHWKEKEEKERKS